jgi:NAD-dependent dihydropyrimidine dehydrogenase PreA subunit
MSTLDIPRDKIPWFPTIDYDKCVGCMECYNFCRNNVFTWDEAKNRPIVKNPYNCVLGCSACTQLCLVGAISFISIEELRKIIRKLRSELESQP